MKLSSTSATACCSARIVSASAPPRWASDTTPRIISSKYSMDTANTSTPCSSSAPAHTAKPGSTAAAKASQKACHHDAPSRQAPPMTMPTRPKVTRAIIVATEYDCSASSETTAGTSANMLRWAKATSTSVATATTVPGR